MAHDSVLKRILKVAYKKATTWGTAVDPTTGDGLYCETLSGTEKVRRLTVDNSAGQQIESTAFHGIDEPPTPSFMVRVQENDAVALLPLAQILGDDTVSGGSDPYTHTMPMQAEANLFGTIAWQEGDEAKHVPSFKPESVELGFNTEGVLELTVSGKGNKVDTATSTILDDVTYSVKSLPYNLSNCTFRINAQSGDALDSGDDLEVADLKLMFARASDSVVTSGAGTIVEPKEEAYPTFSMTFRIPRKNTFTKTLTAALAADTLMKGEVIFGGSSASRELKIQMPQLFVERVDIPFDNVIAANVTLRMQKAAAAPTGMTGVTVPTALWKCGVSGALV